MIHQTADGAYDLWSSGKRIIAGMKETILTEGDKHARRKRKRRRGEHRGKSTEETQKGDKISKHKTQHKDVKS